MNADQAPGFTKRRLLMLLLPPLAVLALYWPALDFGLVWDDAHYLAEPPFRDGPTLMQWAFTPFFGLYFRPLPLLAIGAETLVSGGNSLSHLVSVLLLVINAGLTATLGCLLDRHFRGADSRSAALTGLAAGLLYGLHPALIEATAWISGRFDLMLALFGLATLLADRLISHPIARPACVAILFLLAACCKEMALGLALLLPLWHRLLEETADWKQSLKTHRLDYFGVIAAGLLYLVLRHHFCRDLSSTMHWLDLSVPQRMALTGKTLGGFAADTVLPFFNVGPIHAFQPPASLTDPESWLGLALVAGAAWTVADTLYRRRLRSEQLLMVCFIVALLPAANLIPLAIGESYYQDRYLAFPLGFVSFWAALRLTGSFQASSGRIRAWSGATLGGIWLLLATVCCISLLPSWRDNLSLWTRASARTPQSRFAAFNLQNGLVEAHDYAQARRVFEQLSQAQDPVPALPWLLYSESLRQLGEPQAALQALQNAQSAPDGAGPAMRARIYCRSGLIFLDAGDLQQAQAHLLKSIEYDAADPEATYYLAVLLLAQGQQAQGQHYLDLALRNASPALAAQQRDKLDAFVAQTRQQMTRAP